MITRKFSYTLGLLFIEACMHQDINAWCVDWDFNHTFMYVRFDPKAEGLALDYSFNF